MEFQDLPEDARKAFKEAGVEFANSAQQRKVTKQYIDGLADAAATSSYSEGLSDKFNIPADDFDGLDNKWRQNLDAEEWAKSMAQEGMEMRYAKQFAEAITD